MSDKQTAYADASIRGHFDGRLIAVALIIVVLVSEVALIRLAGPIEPQAIDPASLVGP